MVMRVDFDGRVEGQRCMTIERWDDRITESEYVIMRTGANRTRECES